MKGIKFDQEKIRWDLLPFDIIEDVVKVLMFGSKKYNDNNWKKVENSRMRYFNASLRHIFAWWKGEKNDFETGISHLAHAICCLIFLLWHDKNKDNFNDRI